ncbi:MAG: hypothetical protein VR68_02460 [Peptococcaceae bacterium BRH_c4a]|nr:MAG: hypothetical protein VR68_02460 [Peptococcaceae bacterium BRH_c4a]
MQRIRDMIEGLSDRDRKLLLVVGVCLVLFVFVKFVLLVQIETYQSRGEELEKVAEIRDQLKNKNTKLKSEAEKIVTAQKRLEDLKAVLDRNYEDGSALMALADNAQERQVYISAISPKVRITTDHYIELPISLTVRGTYGKILKMVGDLENSGGVVQIKTMSLEISKMEGKRPVAGDSSGEKEMPPVGRDILLDANLEMSFYTIPGSEKYLTDKILKISQWTKGRGDEAFVFPGPVSPHSSLKPGGDLNIPGVTFRKNENKSSGASVKQPAETGAAADPAAQKAVGTSGERIR